MTDLNKDRTKIPQKPRDDDEPTGDRDLTQEDTHADQQKVDAEGTSPRTAPRPLP